MPGYSTKTYVVQRKSGEVIAVKLRWEDAHAIAKREAPCRVIFAFADKTPDLNVDQSACN